MKETDPLGRETSYQYNDRGRLVQSLRPDHDGDGNPTVTTMTYTARGELETHTDPLGRVTSYLRDALGRTTQITRPDPDGAGPLAAPVTTFAFDKLGRQIEILDPLGNLTATSYENFGRRIITTQADPDGTGPQAAPQTTRDYDAAGNLVSVTDALGRFTAYEYNQLNRLVKVTLPDPDGAGPQTSPTIQYQYDKAGNLRFERMQRGQDSLMIKKPGWGTKVGTRGGRDATGSGAFLRLRRSGAFTIGNRSRKSQPICRGFAGGIVQTDRLTGFWPGTRRARVASRDGPRTPPIGRFRARWLCDPGQKLMLEEMWPVG